MQAIGVGAPQGSLVNRPRGYLKCVWTNEAVLDQVEAGKTARMVELHVDGEPCTGKKRVLTKGGEQLSENGCTLGVGDAVEIVLGCLHVRDICSDGVGGWILVLLVGPGFAANGE